VERGGPRLQPKQAIQLTAKVLCNSIYNSSTPTYTQTRSGFTSPRPGAQFDSSYAMGLVKIDSSFISTVFFWAWLNARNVLCSGNGNQYLGIVSLENGDLTRSQKEIIKKRDRILSLIITDEDEKGIYPLRISTGSSV